MPISRPAGIVSSKIRRKSSKFTTSSSADPRARRPDRESSIVRAATSPGSRSTAPSCCDAQFTSSNAGMRLPPSIFGSPRFGASRSEAADCGLLGPELAAGIRRVKGVRRIGVRLGNWLTPSRVGAFSMTRHRRRRGLRDHAMPEHAWAASSCEISTSASATASLTVADSFVERLSCAVYS